MDLRAGRVGVRPLLMSDAKAWSEVRRRNAAWLTPWEATVPPGDDTAPKTFRGLLRHLHPQGRPRRALPVAVPVD